MPSPRTGTSADEDLMASFDRHQLRHYRIHRRLTAVDQTLTTDLQHTHLGQNGVIGRSAAFPHKLQITQRPVQQQRFQRSSTRNIRHLTYPRAITPVLSTLDATTHSQ
jgi:hypothetical protein